MLWPIAIVALLIYVVFLASAADRSSEARRAEECVERAGAWIEGMSTTFTGTAGVCIEAGEAMAQP